ncbi:MAG TPA: DUF4342 domain-containing protein [Ktedonobacteraceae bacterium]|jgi:hypothetical protein|nr:DUF4342 domain-containing protein [Ktedonobacteraceae bacterium]
MAQTGLADNVKQLVSNSNKYRTVVRLDNGTTLIDIPSVLVIPLAILLLVIVVSLLRRLFAR